jgi:uncharacterized OB-fold protein
MREAAPMWRAAREQRLVMPRCAGCATYAWPPRPVCATCGGVLEWVECSGRARIVTFSVVQRAVDPELKDSVPYVVAIVALDEGVRLFTNIVDTDPATLRVGQRVRCRFEPTDDPEAWVPVFTPEG